MLWKEELTQFFWIPFSPRTYGISSFLVSALPRIIRILHEEADVRWKENKTPLGTFLSVPRLGTGQFERNLAIKRGGAQKRLSAFSWTERSQIRCREAP